MFGNAGPDLEFEKLLRWSLYVATRDNRPSLQVTSSTTILLIGPRLAAFGAWLNFGELQATSLYLP